MGVMCIWLASTGTGENDILFFVMSFQRCVVWCAWLTVLATAWFIVAGGPIADLRSNQEVTYSSDSWSMSCMPSSLPWQRGRQVRKAICSTVLHVPDIWMCGWA